MLSTVERMTIRTFLGFLVGKREAILSIAACPHAFWLGMLFVLSAGFAREYDGAYLPKETWHLALPFQASLGASTLLFLIVYAYTRALADRRWPFWRSYIRFVTLFWMTAPLAWLYAIPVEQFLSPVDATMANLWLLGIVAAWRVVLMIRVIVVLTGAPTISAAAIVLWYGSTAVVLASLAMAIRTVGLMGGVRPTETEAIVANVANQVGVAAMFVWPVCLLLLIVAGVASVRPCPLAVLPEQRMVGPALWGIAFLSIAIWAVVLPFTQPIQQRRYHAERLIRSGEGRQAIRFLSQFRAEEFPPGWMPVTRFNARSHPDVLPLLEAFVSENPPSWIRERLLMRTLAVASVNFDRYDSEYARRFVVVLESLPEAKEFLQEGAMNSSWAYSEDFPPDLLERVKRLMGEETEDVASPDPMVE